LVVAFVATFRRRPFASLKFADAHVRQRLRRARLVHEGPRNPDTPRAEPSSAPTLPVAPRGRGQRPCRPTCRSRTRTRAACPTEARAAAASCGSWEAAVRATGSTGAARGPWRGPGRPPMCRWRQGRRGLPSHSWREAPPASPGTAGATLRLREAGLGGGLADASLLGVLDVWAGVDTVVEWSPRLSGTDGRPVRAGGLAGLRLRRRGAVLADARWRRLPVASPEATWDLRGALRLHLGRAASVSLEARRTSSDEATSSAVLLGFR
jgi:hypothetical protein